MTDEFLDEFLDECDTAYREEYDRWSWRRKPDHKPGFELVRARGDGLDEITNLTKRECKDKHDAESWLRTFRGRAAIRAVLGTLLDAQAKRGKGSRAKLDPLRNNPIVGFMSEAQAERILAEMREERCR